MHAGAEGAGRSRTPDLDEEAFGELRGNPRAFVRPVVTRNVVARLPGSGIRADEAIVVGAHYDHLGIGPPINGDSIYNGAEDNASGTAAVLAAAEAIAGAGARPERSVVFTAFAAEELGLQGSEWLVRHPPAGLRLVGAFAMDVLNLYGKTRDIGTVGVAQSSLGKLLRTAAAAEKLTVNEDPRRSSSGPLLPFRQLCVRTRRHSRDPDGQRRRFRRTTARMGPPAAGAILERAVPSPE